MKTKLQILVFLMIFSSLIVMPLVSLNATDETENDIPVFSSGEDLPSSSYLKKEKRSIANTLESSSFIMPTIGLLSAGENWKDPFLAAQDGESSWPGNVGDKGPIGSVSFPIVLSILLIYLIYRGVTTSRRRNNL